MRNTINVAFIGHLSHGKSTLIGRLFYEECKIPEELFLRLKKHATASGKETLSYAFFIDRTLEERTRGSTIEVSYERLTLNNNVINIINTPGDKDYIKNTISGLTQTDVAVVVVDVKETYENTIQPQTKEHIILSSALGIEQLIVVINKMDLVDYSQVIYEEVKLSIINLLKENNLEFKNIEYIPAAAYFGENITNVSTKMQWYNGYTFKDILSALKPPPRLIDKPLRLPITRTFNISGVGVVIVGRILTGKIKLNDKVTIVPYPDKGLIIAEVNSIEAHYEKLDEAYAGEDVSISLTQLEKKFTTREVKKGCIVAEVSHPPDEVEKFRALLKIINHPSVVKMGYSPYLHCHQAALPCKIIDIEDEKKYLINGDTSYVWIEPQKPLVIEKIDNMPSLSRFVLTDGRVVATGECVEVIKALQK